MLSWWRRLTPALEKKRRSTEAVARAHRSVMSQALHPALFAEGRARDDFFGRFGLAALHAALAMRRLRRCGTRGQDFAQELFDAMFAEFDDAVRETGVGDTGVHKRVRHMGRRFYGAASAIDAALAAKNDALEQTLARNTSFPPPALAAAANYVREAAAGLERTDAEALLEGHIPWPDPDRAFGPAAVPEADRGGTN